ncbi:MAG TPA: trypsin-like serine protease [Vicinamibacterales bacterium]|nr:trypsin-like serine protease [Vicinamibacterales bacterium]
MRRTILLTLVAVFALILVRAQAVTDGKVDGNAHPAVVLLLMEVGGQPAFRCSGTLLSPTVLLTAGHCADDFPDAPFTGMRVFTESDVESGIGKTNNYPFAGANAVEAVSWAAHPLFETGPFFQHDVGVVILGGGGVQLPASQYGKLPTVNQFDQLKTRRGQQDVTFTAVGYGLQESFPDAALFLATNTRTRMSATPRLLQINVPGFTGPFSMLLSNNHNTGGTCFGDSGGPNFVGSGSSETKIVAAVTSFGINGNCAGTGGVFRMDRQDVLDFVQLYLP